MREREIEKKGKKRERERHSKGEKDKIERYRQKIRVNVPLNEEAYL